MTDCTLEHLNNHLLDLTGNDSPASNCEDQTTESKDFTRSDDKQETDSQKPAKLSFGISRILSSPSKSRQPPVQKQSNGNYDPNHNNQMSKLFKCENLINTNATRLAAALHYIKTFGGVQPQGISKHQLSFAGPNLGLQPFVPFLPNIIKVPAFKLHDQQLSQQNSSQHSDSSDILHSPTEKQSGSIMFPWMHDRKDRMTGDPMRC